MCRRSWISWGRGFWLGRKFGWMGGGGRGELGKGERVVGGLGGQRW